MHVRKFLVVVDVPFGSLSGIRAPTVVFRPGCDSFERWIRRCRAYEPDVPDANVRFPIDRGGATCGSGAPRQQAILRVRHEVIDACRDFFNSRGSILADMPIFTPSACEGTSGWGSSAA